MLEPDFTKLNCLKHADIIIPFLEEHAVNGDEEARQLLTRLRQILVEYEEFKAKGGRLPE
jgi:hypothetical protein